MKTAHGVALGELAEIANQVSLPIECATAEVAYWCGLAITPKPGRFTVGYHGQMYEPDYRSYV